MRSVRLVDFKWTKQVWIDISEYLPVIRFESNESWFFAKQILAQIFNLNKEKSRCQHSVCICIDMFSVRRQFCAINIGKFFLLSANFYSFVYITCSCNTRSCDRCIQMYIFYQRFIWNCRPFVYDKEWKNWAFRFDARIKYFAVGLFGT